MPPRIATANTGPSLLDAYWAVPKFTRFLATGAVATAAATQFGVIHPYVLLLLWPKVVGQLQVSLVVLAQVVVVAVVNK